MHHEVHKFGLSENQWKAQIRDDVGHTLSGSTTNALTTHVDGDMGEENLDWSVSIYDILNEEAPSHDEDSLVEYVAVLF